MTGARGGKWEVSDVGTAQRGNWKSTISDTGASIDALDYDTNLVSRYAFGGNANDAVGSNNGTENGSPTYVSGVYGQAINMTSAGSQYVELANPSNFNFANSWTFTAWVKRIGTGGGFTYPIFSKTASGAWETAGKAIDFDSNDKLEFTAFGVGTVTGVTTLDSTTSWYFVSVTHNSTSHLITLYVDAVSDNSSTAYTLGADDGAHVVRVSRRATNYGNIIVDQAQWFSAELTAAEIKQIYNDCHGGMKATCTVTGSGFTKDIKYTRNAENTAWVADADVSNSQTLSTKTLDSTNVLQNTQMHFYNRRFYDWTDLDYLTTGGVGTETIAKGIGHGGNVLTTGASTNDTAFVHYGYDASVAHAPFEVGRKFEAYFLVRFSGSADKLIQVGLFSSARLGQASFDSTQESISFEYDTGVSTNWVVRNGSGAAETSTTSSTNVTTDDILLSIICDESTIKFYADGTLLATHSTNLPTSTTDLFPQVWIKTETTAAQTMYFLRGYGWSDHS